MKLIELLETGKTITQSDLDECMEDFVGKTGRGITKRDLEYALDLAVQVWNVKEA